MSVKSRLKQRKTWLTLEQAAKRLSDEFSEDVTAENILELALEGDLPISVQVYGAQKVMPLQKGEQIGVRSAPSLSPITGYKPGVPGLPEGVTGHVGAGIYQVGIDAPSTRNHLHRLIGSEALGTTGTPAWYLIMDDADGGEPHLFVPLEPVKDTKLLPLPSLQSLLVRRIDLEPFIEELGKQSPELSSEGEELRALEALGLLAETFALKGPSNWRKLETGKPNKAQIAEAMSKQAGEVYGMSKSKLQRLLTDALVAWEERSR